MKIPIAPVLLSSTFLLVLERTAGFSGKHQTSRRSFAVQVSEIVGGSLTAFSIAYPALAKEAEDKEKILSGYKRLNYLLENWEEETTICGRSDNPYTASKGCERTPLKVMEYMGYRSTTDPLFKVDKTLRRLESLVPADRTVDYLDAVEKLAEAADEASGMAYVSSWGEANPGGGKDRVEYFIERAKKNVMDARESLGTVIDILQIS